mgnify:CR=1 FL=1
MQVKARVTRGHRVASGQSGDPRFPGGTLAMQLPHFAGLGLDLNGFYLATLNLSIAPLDFEIAKPDFRFSEVKWHETEPAEDFSFVNCRLRKEGENQDWVDGFVYYPHPETKPEHFQPPGVLEVILKRYLEDVQYGDQVFLEVSRDRIRFEDGQEEVRDQGR